MAEEETKDTEVDENSDDQNTEGEAPKALGDDSGKINPEVLQSIPVTISVEVGKTSLKIRDLLRLTQGSVVELERLAGEPLDLLVNNTVVAQGEVVLVNDLDEKEIAQIKNKFPKMTVHFVAGDFTHEEILQKANVLMSNTVVILPNIAAGENEPHDEKTVFATLTIKNLDSSLRVIAYIHDRENLTHIKRANADEVVVVDDMSTHLLASHVIDPGVPQIANQLMNSGSSYHFKRKQIPDEFVGKTFDTLFNHFRSKDGSILIGLYAEDENLGIGEILSTDTSALDEFIERKLKEGGVPLHDQSKIHVSVNPKKNYVLQDGEHAIIIP